MGFDFWGLFDPSTTLGAFLISVLASLFTGFFAGKKYQTHKTNRINVNQVDGDIYQGNGKNDKGVYEKNEIQVYQVQGSIHQDSLK